LVVLPVVKGTAEGIPLDVADREVSPEVGTVSAEYLRPSAGPTEDDHPPVEKIRTHDLATGDLTR
jgi:hypothetical protein